MDHAIDRPTPTGASAASPIGVDGALASLVYMRSASAEADVVAARPAPSAQRVLLVASLFNMPYRVMRCASTAGADQVYVLASEGARGLAWSRHCTRLFSTVRPIDGSRDPGLAAGINRLAREFGITAVVPGDAAATRALIAAADLIAVPCFPLPGLPEFDLLNDKAAFAELCRSLDIRCPATRLFADAGALATEIAAGRVPCPAIVKPVNLSGGEGVYRLDRHNPAETLRRIDYRPVVVQEFVEGDDVCAAAFCRAGVVRAFAGYRPGGGTFSTFRDQRILDDVGRILRPLKVDGVFNFDMRLTAAGEIYFIECNPRFFYTIDRAMLAGINFVGLGLAGRCDDEPMLVADAAEVRYPRALLRSPRHWNRASLRHALYPWSDPIPKLLERLKMLG
jgi:predicted ATP-grasp superfamily ATP-dependent carboligase